MGHSVYGGRAEPWEAHRLGQQEWLHVGHAVGRCGVGKQGVCGISSGANECADGVEQHAGWRDSHHRRQDDGTGDSGAVRGGKGKPRGAVAERGISG